MEEPGMTASITTPVSRDVAGWIKYGILGGAIAGIVFALFEMIVAALMMGGEAFFMPLRMIGGIALGPPAMDPQTSLLTAGVAGLVVHMVLSVVYGVATAAVLSLIPQLSASSWAVIISASVAGLALWIVNFYVFAPVFGWTWFPNDTNPVVLFVAHTFFYGTVLGIYLNAVRAAWVR
jgi:hypothetical protein